MVCLILRIEHGREIDTGWLYDCDAVLARA
jgi:hypothetical protein